jgi:hypothetical protein
MRSRNVNHSTRTFGEVQLLSNRKGKSRKAGSYVTELQRVGTTPRSLLEDTPLVHVF